MRLHCPPRLAQALGSVGVTPRTEDQSVDARDLAKLGSTVNLYELLNGTYYVSSRPPRPRAAPKTKEYERLMSKLTDREKEREYRALIGEEVSAEEVASIAHEDNPKRVREQLSTIVNVLVSVGSVFWALWYTAGGYDVSTRLLVALAGALLVLVAEVVVYLRYIQRIDEARVIERAKAESREVVRSFEISADGIKQVPVGTTGTEQSVETTAIEESTGTTGVKRSTATRRRH